MLYRRNYPKLQHFNEPRVCHISFANRSRLILDGRKRIRTDKGLKESYDSRRALTIPSYFYFGSMNLCFDQIRIGLLFHARTQKGILNKVNEESFQMGSCASLTKSANPKGCLLKPIFCLKWIWLLTESKKSV